MEAINFPPLVLWHASHQVLQDCDCACVSEATASLKLPLEDGPWKSVPPLAVLPLNEQWDAYLNPAGPAGLVVLNKTAQRLLNAFSTPASFPEVASRFPMLPAVQVEDALHELALTGLIRPVQRAGEHGKHTTLTVWLHLTEACNLRCPYCYVRKSPRRMDEATARLAIKRVARIAAEHGYRRLQLKYAGGEPTLNFEVLKAAHSYASALTAELGLELEAVLLTNGVALTEAMLDFIADEGIRLSVSLDGGPKEHDRLRASQDYEATYERVIANVDKALQRGLIPHVSITVTALNLHGITDAVRFAIERELPFNLNFYRATGGENSGLAPGAEALIAVMEQVLDLLGNELDRIPYPLTGILDRTHFDIPHNRVCSAGLHYLAVDTRGGIAPCHMLLGRHSLESNAADPLRELQERWGQAFNPPVETLAECQSCLWRFTCAGGCPLLRKSELHKRYCRVYKAILPGLVKLEARRILHRYAEKMHPTVDA